MRVYQARDRVLKSDSIYKMLEVNPGSGWLVWTSSCTQGRNDTFMESNFEVYLDDETEPSIKTSGGEDWYRSGFYYYNIPYDKPYMMCNVRNNRTHCTSVGIDLMELHGGIKFDHSIKTQLDVRESNTDFDICWSQLYYTVES